MIKTIRSQNNQSTYDMANQAYGGLDLLVKLCRDNGIQDLNFSFTTPVNLNYDDNIATNRQNTVDTYATAIQNSQNGDPAYSGAYSGAYS